MKYIFLLLFFICFCSPKQPEDFHKFIKRFYNDTTFQLSRIEFPIDVKEISDEIENDSGSLMQVYTKDNWRFRSRKDSDTMNFKIWYTVKDVIATKVVEFF